MRFPSAEFSAQSGYRGAEVGPAARAADAVSPWRARLMLGGVMLVAGLGYLRCLGNDFVWDDDQLIVNNPRIARWSFFRESFFRDFLWFGLHKPRYRPLLLAWFGLNYHLFALNPVGWHAAMIGLHLLVIWLVFKVTARVTGDQSTALVTALLFGVIPINAESVVWPGGGGGLVLAAAFELAAFYLVSGRSGARWRPGLPALLLYAGALLSHESAVSFPALIAAYLFLSGSPGSAEDPRATSFASRVWRAVVGAAPFAGEMAAYLIVRRLVLGSVMGWTAPTLSTAEALLTVPKALCWDLALLALPWLADPVHPIAIVRSAAAADFYLPLLALIALAIITLLAMSKGGRARSRVFWAAWIVIAIAPTMALGSRLQDNIVCDSYLYLSSVGSCVLLADLIHSVARWVRAARLAPIAAAALALSYVAVLWHVQHFWLNDEVLCMHGMTRSPESSTWHAGLAAALSRRGDNVGAERELQTAHRLAPADVETLYSLGLVHAQMGRTAEAAGEISESVGELSHPSADMYVVLANLHKMEGSVDAVGQDLSNALRIDPDNPAALYGMGVLDWRRGHAQEGAIEISRALQLMTTPPWTGYAMLASLYSAQGDRADAEAALDRAGSLPEGEPSAELARANVELAAGDTQAAEKTLRRAASNYPNEGRIEVALGFLLASENRDQEALAAYQRAIMLAPTTDTLCRVSAARLLHKMGRDREALELAREAARLAPGNADAQALIKEINRPGPPH